MTTINEVALLAGVSIKSVSRVVNGEPHVSAPLRAKVLAAIEALDYRPNLAARQLAGRRSFLLALLVCVPFGGYEADLLVAASAEAQLRGYHLVLETFEPSEAHDDVARRVVGRLRPDGIILPPPLSNDEALVATLTATGVPLARLATTLDGYDGAIPVNERPIALELMRHLLSLGHRRIGMIASPSPKGAAHDRLLAYRQALAEAGIDADVELVVTGDFGFDSGIVAAERLLSLRERPTAIFAANDEMALGAMAAARAAGLRIPLDIAIAGFDDAPASRMVFPPLTTVRQPIATLARAAVSALIDKDVLVEPLEYELLVRGSTLSRRSDRSA